MRHEFHPRAKIIVFRALGFYKLTLQPLYAPKNRSNPALTSLMFVPHLTWHFPHLLHPASVRTGHEHYGKLATEFPHSLHATGPRTNEQRANSPALGPPSQNASQMHCQIMPDKMLHVRLIVRKCTRKNARKNVS